MQEYKPLIKLNNVQKTYKTGVGDFPALKGVDLELYEGECREVYIG